MMNEDQVQPPIEETPQGAEAPEVKPPKRPARITAITLENFKSIGAPVRIPLRDITLLFGPNSAGKSTIIHAIQYAGMVLSGKNPDSWDSEDNTSEMGGFRTLLHGRNTSRTMRIGIEIQGDDIAKIMSKSLERTVYANDANLLNGTLNIDDTPYLDFGKISPKVIYVTFSLQWTNNQVFLSEYAVDCDRVPFLKISCAMDGASKLYINPNHPFVSLICNNETDGLSYSPEEGTVYDTDTSEYHCLSTIIANYNTKNNVADRKAKNGFDILEEEDEEEEWICCPIINQRSALPTKKISFEKKDDLVIDQAKVAELKSSITEAINKQRDEFRIRCKSMQLDENIINDIIGPPHLPKSDDEIKESFYNNINEVNDLTIDYISIGSRELLLRLINDVRYLGPLRQVPPRNFIPVNHAGTNRWFNGMAAWDALFLDEENLIDRSNGHLKHTLGCPYSLNNIDVIRCDKAVIEKAAQKGLDVLKDVLSRHAYQRIQVRDTLHNVDVELPDIGTGLSQLIPVIVGVAHPGTSLFAVQEPELHAHPGLQARLADVFLKERKHPAFLETHSEHLILRILRRIRETSRGTLPEGFPSIRPEDVQVLYLKPSENGTEVYPLDITEDGDFINDWPDGFFTEREEDLF
ncbi:MAG: DUF3696 domain-containing protein [Candidatus Hydrogenedentes bacterium]|nr:DUF3696 domain-containing protein [Candidatus Hydrogenedentota bacterium]